jgi:hypothetical protein
MFERELERRLVRFARAHCKLVLGVANVLASGVTVNSICLVHCDKKRHRILWKGGEEERLHGEWRKCAIAACSGRTGAPEQNLVNSRARFPQGEHRKCRKPAVGRWPFVVSEPVVRGGLSDVREKSLDHKGQEVTKK